MNEKTMADYSSCFYMVILVACMAYIAKFSYWQVVRYSAYVYVLMVLGGFYFSINTQEQQLDDKQNRTLNALRLSPY